MPERFRRNGFSYRLPLLSAYAVALILSAMRYVLAVDNVSDIVIHIQVVIVSGFHLFPFRTEKLSPSAPMVLHTRGRVGSRRFSRRRDPVRNSRVSLLLFILFWARMLVGSLCFCLYSLGRDACRGGLVLGFLARLVFLVFLVFLDTLAYLAYLVLGNPRRS